MSAWALAAALCLAAPPAAPAPAPMVSGVVLKLPPGEDAAILDKDEQVNEKLDLSQIGGSALTDRSIAVPTGGVQPGIPVTYVPARNTLFLAFALGAAETAGATEIVIGANALDYSGYPDCRPEFVRAFEALAGLATVAGVQGARYTVHAPLMALDKAGIVRLGASLGVDFALTHSCYDPSPAGEACGACDACRLRLKGFREAGLEDPVRYLSRPEH